MALTIPRVFGPLTGPIPLNYLDADFTALAQTFVGSIAELRTLPKTGSGAAITLGYYAPGDRASPFLAYTLDVTDITSTDNGGTIIVANDGGRWKLPADCVVDPDMFGAQGVPFGSTPNFDSSAMFTAMWSLGLPFSIPPKRYLLSTPQYPSASGTCYGQLVVAAGFTGAFITISNPNYGVRWTIIGLDVFSTDVRPSPYTGSATKGIYVGPDGAHIGVAPCPDVTLIGCAARRFSYGLHVSTFNVDCYSCQFEQNDHNVLLYTTDTTFNQINDFRLYNCACDSPASSVGQPYALRIGTVGNGTYVSSIGMGYNVQVIGCNFDAAPVFVDNLIGFEFRSYCEQSAVYTYHGGAVVLGSAGTNTLQNVKISQSTFNNFDYAVVEANAVLGLFVGPNTYSAVKYRALVAVACESWGFHYVRGTSIGSFNANGDEVATNFSAGASDSQLTFSGITIDSDFLNAGAQLAPTTASTTSWYPRGLTNDGNQALSSSNGRYRSGSAVQTAIAGTQAGNVFTFTTQAQASLFTGGDAISASAGGAIRVLSVDYVAGTAVLDSTFTGAVNVSHAPAYFVGYNLSGSGSPQGVITANPGSRYVNVGGGAGTTTYVKETGTGNTGWAAK
jgi:hypothetical protein